MQLVYSEQELHSEHPYARPQRECGRTLHGGFDADGRYLSPRTALRWPAVRAWTAALEARGLERLRADRSLLVAGRYPSYEQMKLMLDNGLGRSLWNSLTLTGEIEGRGRFLVGFRAPEFSDVVYEDVSELAVGHRGRGLLSAHGLDEAGDSRTSVGGHDAMWFAVRDLLFGRDAYPAPAIPPHIGRPGGRAAGAVPARGPRGAVAADDERVDGGDPGREAFRLRGAAAGRPGDLRRRTREGRAGARRVPGPGAASPSGGLTRARIGARRTRTKEEPPWSSK